MSSLRLLLLFVAWITVVAADPLRAHRIRREINPSLSTSGKQLLTEASVGHVLFNAPSGARLFRSLPQIPALSDRLIDNYTEIIENAVDTFRCNDLGYGYYADVDNNCQIFHVCLPLKDIYPANFTKDTTYQFSFVCPKYTIFSQDSLVCAWEEEAVPCEFAPDLFWINDNFFRKVPKEDGTGDRFAHVNEPFKEDP